MNGTVRLGLITILAGSVLAGCPGGGDKGARSNSGGPINVAIVANPQAQDLARLTPSVFTAQSNINVNYTILAEGTLREVITSSARAGDGARSRGQLPSLHMDVTHISIGQEDHR